MHTQASQQKGWNCVVSGAVRSKTHRLHNNKGTRVRAVESGCTTQHPGHEKQQQQQLLLPAVHTGKEVMFTLVKRYEVKR